MVLVNSNPVSCLCCMHVGSIPQPGGGACSLRLSLQATIMTDPGTADRTYIGPMTPELVEEIIAKARHCCCGWLGTAWTAAQQTQFRQPQARRTARWQTRLTTGEHARYIQGRMSGKLGRRRPAESTAASDACSRGSLTV